MTNITLSELLKTNLLTDTTKASIIKQGKMGTSVKASVIKQLEHKFESVEYVRGSKWKDPSFNLGEPLHTTSNYNQYANVGRPRVRPLEEEAEVSIKNNKVSNISKGEFLVSEFLKYKEINFLYQVRFSDCKYKKTLPFDFGILNGDGEVVALVEFDGEQHYQPVETWGGEQTLKEVQIRDKVKDDYCKRKGIPLLRIKYNEENILKTIEEFIAQEQRKVAN